MKTVKDQHYKQHLDQTRRDFVKKSALAGVAVASTAAVPGAALASESPRESGEKVEKGYQLTPHVLAYYKSAAS